MNMLCLSDRLVTRRRRSCWQDPLRCVDAAAGRVVVVVVTVVVVIVVAVVVVDVVVSFRCCTLQQMSTSE